MVVDQCSRSVLDCEVLMGYVVDSQGIFTGGFPGNVGIVT